MWMEERDWASVRVVRCVGIEECSQRGKPGGRWAASRLPKRVRDGHAGLCEGMLLARGVWE